MAAISSPPAPARMASRNACMRVHPHRLPFPPPRGPGPVVRLARPGPPSRRLWSTLAAGYGRQRYVRRSVPMPGSVIVAGARTPIGKLSGALASFSAMDLGGVAIAAALERAGIAPDAVDYVFMGQVLQAGQGQITARQAATNAGIPMSVPARTVNKVCLSGLNTIYLADLLIQSGEAEIVVAGGMESMTQAPYLLPGARAGYRLGDGTLVDSMMYDGLFCAVDQCAMGLGTERYNGADGVSRERQDAFSALSHERAAAAIKDGRFADEIVPVRVPRRKGDPLVVETDEGVRPETTAESLGALRPAFDKNGTITAANPSRISDGGAAVIVVSRDKAEERGLTPRGELVS